MDFRTEFFPLLNNALFKENNDISEHIVTNSDIYLFNRYTSFYHYKLAELVNNTTNKLSNVIYNDKSGEYLFQVLSTVLPKLNKKYIKYISKPKGTITSDADIFVKEYSRRHNMSEREVWGMLYQLDQIQGDQIEC